MALEFMYNAQDELSPHQLLQRYQHDLPQLVIVSQGFYSNREEMTFSNGQVLRLHEVRCQERALVHDDQKKTLSIPLDYHLLFYVDSNPTEALTLRQIVQRHSLPVKVKLTDKQVQFSSIGRSRPLNVLKVIEKHTEMYFIANNIMQGRVSSTVIPIPMYLTDVKFCPLTGVKGRSIFDGGRQLMTVMLHPTFMGDIDFWQDHSDKEMVQLSEKPLKAVDNIYESIDTIYINASSQHRVQSLSAVQYDSLASVAASSANTYMNLEQEEKPPKLPSRPACMTAQATRRHSEVYPQTTYEADHLYHVPVESEHRYSSSTGPEPPQIQSPSVSLASELQLALQKRKSRGKSAVQDLTRANTDTQPVSSAAGDSPASNPPWKVHLRTTRQKPSALSSPEQPAEADTSSTVPKPDTPVKPALNTKPGTPVTPALNTKPDTPVKPVLNTKPDTPVKPVLNTKPDTPVTPALNTKPDTPVKPVLNTKPDTPVKPVLNTKPDTPVKPALNTKPDTPVKPVLNTKPDTPVTGTTSIMNTKPDTPVTGTTPVMNTKPGTSPIGTPPALNTKPGTSPIGTPPALNTKPHIPVTGTTPALNTKPGTPHTGTTSALNTKPGTPHTGTTSALNTKPGTPHTGTTSALNTKPGTPVTGSTPALNTKPGTPVTGSTPALNTKPALCPKPSASKADPQPPVTHHSPNPRPSNKADAEEPGVEEPQPPSSSRTDLSPSPPEGVSQSTTERPPILPRDRAGPTAPVSDSRKYVQNIYVNEQEMAIIPPTQSRGSNPVSKQGAAPSRLPDQPLHILADRRRPVPASSSHDSLNQTLPPANGSMQAKTAPRDTVSQTLDRMTMADVQQVLTQLNLTQYRDLFHINMVDGVLLRELDEDMLKEDFGMSRTEIKRLLNFVRTGHLPK